ncbi:MAG TPA: helix-turn-helix domain-containing protein [Devosia sp.]|nr:helix-turn-helix domain-containing protein [Devosia sp.]
MTGPRFAKIPAGAIVDLEVTAKDFRVLCLLARHTDKLGWCRRSQVTMAKELECARSTVQLSIERLILAGWLVKRADRSLHTRGIRDSAHEYQVLMAPARSPVSESPVVDQKSAPPAAPDSAPPADPCVGTYVNETLLTKDSLTADRERVLFDDLWAVFPRRPLTDRSRVLEAFRQLQPGDQAKCLRAAKRMAQWHIEDCEDRRVPPDTQLKYRPALDRWIRSGQWIDTLMFPLRSEPSTKFDEPLIMLPATHPDVAAVEKMRGRRVTLGKSGNATLSVAEVERARTLGTRIPNQADQPVRPPPEVHRLTGQEHLHTRGDHADRTARSTRRR